MVIDKVRRMLSDIIGVPSEQVSGRMTLTKQNGVELLDIAKLVIACEREYKITIHDEDVQAFSSLEDLAAYIDQLLSDGLYEMRDVTDEDRIAWYYE